MNGLDQIQSLIKAMEAGNYNAAPSTLVQGAALQVEDLSPVMHNVTFDESHIKLQKALKVVPCKSTLAQFDRQLSYGMFGGSATLEGNVGQEETSDFVRIVVPMCYYSHLRRVTIVANMVDTVDGKKADDRAAEDAGKKLAGDIEFDLFRGKDDFSNGGAFDGNPLCIPALPNILGLGAQIRQSDNQQSAKDLMFGEYGSDDSVIIAGGAGLTQDQIEDASVRSAMNFGSAERLIVDPKVLANYNKIAFGKERIFLAGSPQEATSADLRKQWVSGGTVNLEASRFLSGKTRPQFARANGPTPPVTVVSASATVAGVVTPFIIGQVYAYFVTSGNEVGESGKVTATGVLTVAASGDEMQLTITQPSVTPALMPKYYNVYRSAAGGTVATAKFIGRVAAGSAGTCLFYDLGNMQPGAVNAFLLSGDTMEIRQLSSYSSLKLAITDLSTPMAYFQFLCLAVTQPRKNCIVSNLR